MKKLLLMIAAATMLFSCNNESSKPEQHESILEIHDYQSDEW